MAIFSRNANIARVIEKLSFVSKSFLFLLSFLEKGFRQQVLLSAIDNSNQYKQFQRKTISLAAIICLKLTIETLEKGVKYV